MSIVDPIRILIVDDHDMLRQGLASFVRAYSDLKLVGETSSGIEAIHLCKELKPDVVLMDLVMPEMDGVTAIREIHRSHPQIRVIALTSFSEENLVKDAIQAGATSYILKNVSPQKLADSIRATHCGVRSLSPEVLDVLVDTVQAVPLFQKKLDSLTKREREVLGGMTEGLTNAQIGMKLNISQYTIKSHVSRILEKLEVSSRTEAVTVALKNNPSKN
jgi:two-component system, NarL family, response regulator LiaR